MNHLFEISFGLAMTAIVGFAVRGAPVGGSASVTLREMDSPWKRFYLTLTLLGYRSGHADNASVSPGTALSI